MFKKTIALVVGMTIMLSTSLVAFSLYEQPKVSNSELENSFEIIEPRLKSKKELYIRDNLLVSISLSEEFKKFQIPVEMSLYSVKEYVELENTSGRLIQETLSSDKISLNNVKFKDLSKLNLIGLTNERISEIYSDLSVYKTYLNSVLKLTREKMLELNNSESSKTKQMTSSEKERVADLAKLEQKVLDELDLVKVRLEKTKNVYNSLFERQIGSSISIEKTGLLPYFKYTYESLEVGQYRLEFVRKDNNVLIKTFDFSINKKSQLTEEKIRENIIESLDILYRNN